MTTSLREHDIRPQDTEAEQKRRYESDVRRLLARRAEFVEVSCPACGADARTPHFQKYTLDYQRCLACQTVYISPRPSPDILDDYYRHSENYAYWNAVIFPASETARRERIFKPRVARVIDICRAHSVATNLLVEVGAGFGTFCEEMMQAATFKRVVAVEPTPSLADTCRTRGVEVIQSTIEQARLEHGVDVVVSFEVIEHLFDPAAFVVRCRDVLRSRGLLVLTCPNIQGFDIDVLGPVSPAIDVEHLNYFHPASLSALLVSHGFEVLETSTPGRLDADIVRNRVQSGEFTLPEGFLRRVLIDDWERLGAKFQDFLIANCLSSNMWVVARKLAAQ